MKKKEFRNIISTICVLFVLFTVGFTQAKQKVLFVDEKRVIETGVDLMNQAATTNKNLLDFGKEKLWKFVGKSQKDRFSYLQKQYNMTLPTRDAMNSLWKRLKDRILILKKSRRATINGRKKMLIKLLKSVRDQFELNKLFGKKVLQYFNQNSQKLNKEDRDFYRKYKATYENVLGLCEEHSKVIDNKRVNLGDDDDEDDDDEDDDDDE